MRNPPHILLVPGSARSGSTNVAALRTAREVVPGDVATTAIFEGLAGLPHFNPDHDYEPLPEPVVELRRQIALADGVLFSTPEYMGTLPGSFKNLLEWTVGGPEMDGKPVAWLNVAARGRGDGAQRALANVLGYLGANPLEPSGRRVFVSRKSISADGLIESEEVRARIAAAVATFAGLLASPEVTVRRAA